MHISTIAEPNNIATFVDRANGQVSISTTVPDTITSWIASAFAVNKRSGLGIADSTAKVLV